MKLSIRCVHALTEIPAMEWNRIAGDNPFLRHEFLSGLELHHCLERHGWHPRHIAAYTEGTLIGAVPLYLKSNSIGEFVFDWDWAEAYARARKSYYPKLVSAIPFTPVAGARLLAPQHSPEQETIKTALVQAAINCAENEDISGVHVLFPDEQDKETLLAQGCLLRTANYYHWHNRGYHNFDEFLDVLTAKRRKQIRKERQSVVANRIQIEILHGGEISDRQWEIFQQFYDSTFARKWGEPRLTLPFFQSLSRKLPDNTVLFLARHEGEYVAGAFAMRNNNTLYGRHWGCSKQFRFLHFELCYYQTIAYCIRHHLSTLDAGVQGEYKLSRGLVPAPAWSAHWIRDRQLRKAIAHYLAHEKLLMAQHLQELTTHTAYKEVAAADDIAHDQGTLRK